MILEMNSSFSFKLAASAVESDAKSLLSAPLASSKQARELAVGSNQNKWSLDGFSSAGEPYTDHTVHTIASVCSERERDGGRLSECGPNELVPVLHVGHIARDASDLGVYRPTIHDENLIFCGQVSNNIV